jgi:hypothetical protein
MEMPFRVRMHVRALYEVYQSVKRRMVGRSIQGELDRILKEVVVVCSSYYPENFR